MEKDIGRITKNPTTEIVVRVDDFADKRGLTIREFVTSERYTGFTKAGVRIQAADFVKFKEIINSVSADDMKSEAPAEEDLLADAYEQVEQETQPIQSEAKQSTPTQSEATSSSSKDELPDY